MNVLNGKQIAQSVDEQTARRLQEHTITRPAKLAVVLIGHNPDSLRYIKQKEKKCNQFGIEFLFVQFPENSEFAAVKSGIQALNDDATVDGIILQLPLPKAFYVKNEGYENDGASLSRLLIDCITPDKDIDGLTLVNIGKYNINDHTGFIPATPQGVMTLLAETHTNITGKKVVIIGRSSIVGKPLIQLLLEKNAIVSVLHSYAPKDVFIEITKGADIIVAAAVVPRLVQANMVKEGAIVIDVGTNVTAENTLVGDVDFAAVSQKAAYISPVPGGVGPLTVSYLIANLVTAYIAHGEKENTIS